MTTSVSPVQIYPGSSATTIANTTRKYRLPGRRTCAEINALRAERAERRRDPEPITTAAQRVTSRRVAAYLDEIARRGGELAIHDKDRSVQVGCIDGLAGTGPQRLMLLGVDGWRYYSSRTPARPVKLRYLAGMDDNGPFAVRVPGTVNTVAAAVAALTPAVVRDATKRVIRQGDMYALETTPAHDTTAATVIADTHHWDPESRTLTHIPEDGRAHTPVVIPWPVRFVAQTAYRMGRGAGRGLGD